MIQSIFNQRYILAERFKNNNNNNNVEIYIRFYSFINYQISLTKPKLISTSYANPNQPHTPIYTPILLSTLLQTILRISASLSSSIKLTHTFE